MISPLADGFNSHRQLFAINPYTHLRFLKWNAITVNATSMKSGVIIHDVNSGIVGSGEDPDKSSGAIKGK